MEVLVLKFSHPLVGCHVRAQHAAGVGSSLSASPRGVLTRGCVCLLPRLLRPLQPAAAAALLPGLHADDPHRRPRGRPQGRGAGPHGLLPQRQPGHVRHHRQVRSPSRAPRLGDPPTAVLTAPVSSAPPGVSQTTASTAAAAPRPGTRSTATAAALDTLAPPVTPVSTRTCTCPAGGPSRPVWSVVAVGFTLIPACVVV